MKRDEPSSIRKHCGCCGTLPSVCPSCRPAVRSTDSRSNNRQGRNTPPPPCRRLIVASSAPPAASLSSPAPFSSRSDRTDSGRPSLLLCHQESFGALSFIRPLLPLRDYSADSLTLNDQLRLLQPLQRRVYSTLLVGRVPEHRGDGGWTVPFDLRAKALCYERIIPVSRLEHLI